MKKCGSCKIIKPISAFYKNHITRDGLCSKCKKCTYEYKIKWNSNNSKYLKEYRLSRQKTNIDTWRTLIPNKTKCQVCGKEIILASGNREVSIHFDHRNGGVEKIKKDPTTFLYTHPMTPENKLLWQSCDFGMLCRGCNKKIPTQNRDLWLKNVTHYVLGS